MTDNQVYDKSHYTGKKAPPVGLPGSADDDWVFTEDNPERELEVAAGLAATSRPLRALNSALAEDCCIAAQELWTVTKEKKAVAPRWACRRTTDRHEGQKICGTSFGQNVAAITVNFDRVGWVVGRSLR